MTRILLIGLVILFSLSALAQKSENIDENLGKEPERGRSIFEVGIQNSFNLSSLYGTGPQSSIGVIDSELNPSGYRLTISVGAFGNYYLTKNLSLQLEIMYAFYGSQFLMEQTIYQDLGYIKRTNNVTYAFQYIKLPLSLQYYFSKRIFVQGGGYFASLRKYKPYEFGFDGGEAINKIDHFESIDWGIITGVGLETQVVRMEFRFNYGFTNIFVNKSTADLHNAVFEIVAHWKLWNRKN
jgi:hypothetical protein